MMARSLQIRYLDYLNKKTMNKLIYTFLIMNTILSSTCNAQSPSPPPDFSDINWNTDMRYGNFPERDKETKDAMAIVNKTLRARQKAYPRFKVGNVGFIDIITSPHPQVMDANSSTHTVAVILGEKPQMVAIANKELFALFAKNIRRNPEQIELSRRIGVAVLLATGSRHTLDNDKSENNTLPPWSDDGSTLVIRFKRLSGGGMMRPRCEACTLTVDENQHFTLECVDEGNIY
jgi:hypothetical protein